MGPMREVVPGDAGGILSISQPLSVPDVYGFGKQRTRRDLQPFYEHHRVRRLCDMGICRRVRFGYNRLGNSDSGNQSFPGKYESYF